MKFSVSLFAIAALFGSCSASVAGSQDTHSDFAWDDSLSRVDTLRVHRDLHAARGLAESLLARAESEPTPDSLRIASVLESLTRVRLFQKAFPEARLLIERCISIRENALGPDHPDVARSMTLLGTALHRLGEKERARALAESALAIQEKSLGPEHVDVAATLDLLCYVLRGLRDGPGSRRAGERAVAIREKLQGPDHPDLANSLGTLAFSIPDTDGGYAEALPMLRRVAEIMRKAYGPFHWDAANTEHNLAIALHENGDYAEAREVWGRAIEAFEGLPDSSRRYVFMPLFGLGRLFHFDLSEFDSARVYLERALVVAEEQFGPEDAYMGFALVSLGELLLDSGDYDGARPLFERSLAVREKVARGGKSLDVAWSLSSLGILHSRTGDFAAARTEVERALEMREELEGPDDAIVAYSLIQMASLMRDTGDFGPAVPLYERAWEIRRRVNGEKHVDSAEPLQELARLHLRTGDLASARREFRKALDIVEAAQGAGKYQSVSSLAGLAEVARESGQPAEAQAFYERALAIVRESFGEEHSDVAWLDDCLGDLALDQGDMGRALEFYDRAAALYERTFGPSHPAIADALIGEASALRALGRSAEAFDAALRADEIGREHLKLTVRNLSERQGLAYAQVRVSGLDPVLAIAARTGDRTIAARTPEDVPGAVGRAWDALVRSRALIFDEVAARRRVSPLMESDSLSLRFTSAQRRLANLLVRGRGDMKPETYRALLDAARTESENAERAIAERSETYRRQVERDEAGLEEVLAALPAGSALLSIATCPATDTAARYIAFVATAAGPTPRLVDLGGAAEIDSLVSDWRRAIALAATSAGPKTESRYREVAAALRKAVWDPVAPALEEAGTVFVVPDGSLLLVNLAVFPVGEDEYLVERGPALHYLGAERDLLDIGDGARRGSTLLAIGDPDYDRASGPAGEPAGAATVLAMATRGGASEATGTFRGETPGCGEFDRLRWNRLPGTGPEIEEVASRWESAEGARTTRLTGAEASEAAFKRLAPAHSLLHVATHGFFVDEHCAAAAAGARGIGGLSRPGDSSAKEEPEAPAKPHSPDERRAPTENPLRLSGLVLAGANARGHAGADEEDGILTAEEIAALDLSRVDWAVLSACETGVGDVRLREGVFGLRRAFQVAGAGTLIMSLWSVDDDATREWMGALYEARLAQGLGTADAVRQASRAVLADRRARGQSTHPFYWASFVAAGDWR